MFTLVKGRAPVLRKGPLKHKRCIRSDVVITITYRRIRGKLRQVFNVRFAPLETQKFPWGVLCGKTLVEAKAKSYARDISTYIDEWEVSSTRLKRL